MTINIRYTSFCVLFILTWHSNATELKEDKSSLIKQFQFDYKSASNPEKKFIISKKYADKGVSSEQFQTGFRYEQGKGVTQNIDEAINYYKKAADQYHLSAQYNLAKLYFKFGHFDDSLKLINKFITSSPNNVLVKDLQHLRKEINVLRKDENAFIQQHLYSNEFLKNVEKIHVTVKSKPSAETSDLVYEIDKSYIDGNKGQSYTSIPLIGLYQNYKNTIQLKFYGENKVTVNSDTLSFKTPKYKQTNEPYNSWMDATKFAPTIVKNYTDGKPSFEYFYMRSISESSPVIMDIDGEIRWIRPYTKPISSTENYFDRSKQRFFGLNMDGQLIPSEVQLESKYEQFNLTYTHHNVRPGKFPDSNFILINNENDQLYRFESTIYEKRDGKIINSWDLGDLISGILLKSGVKKSEYEQWIRTNKSFVREKINKYKNECDLSYPLIFFHDWCHINDVFYDKQDDTITISCREQFVINIDYDIADNDEPVNWILGSPEKEWHKYEALRELALEINVADDIKHNNKILTKEIYQEERLYPIGQHSVSKTRNGNLMMFNNGLASHFKIENFFEAVTLDSSREASYVQQYKVDKNSKTATLVWQYAPKNEENVTQYSMATSSAYEYKDYMLVTLSNLDNRTKSIIRIIDSNTKEQLFEVTFPRLSAEKQKENEQKGRQKEGNGYIVEDSTPLDLSNLTISQGTEKIIYTDDSKSSTL